MLSNLSNSGRITNILLGIKVPWPSLMATESLLKFRSISALSWASSYLTELRPEPHWMLSSVLGNQQAVMLIAVCFRTPPAL